MGDEMLVNWFKLTQVRGLGPGKLQKLINIFHDTNAIFQASDSDLKRTRLFTDEMLHEWNKLKGASNENFYNAISQCKENNIQIMPLYDKRYPKNLKSMPYPPKTLFLTGNISLLKKRKIAIVGTRKPGGKALEWTKEAAKQVSEAGYVIASGGAEGIDYAAHAGAMEKGETVCVFGTGLLHYFPLENKELFDKIKKHGLIISEHLPNFPGSRYAFIQRNRITSGISDILFLVASTAQGGSMVQTKIACEQRVPIFCPAMSLEIFPNEGIKQAISMFGAKEIHSIEELLEKLKAEKPTQMTLYSVEGEEI